MPKRSPFAQRSGVSHRPLLLIVLATALAAQTACSPGENSILNPDSNRTGLTALPETVRVGTASADRSYRAELSTGRLSELRVARTDSVETVAFLRFTSLPDTAGLTGARVGLRLSGGAGAGLRLAAYEVVSGEVWSETELRFEDIDRLAAEPFDVYPDPLDAIDDTSFVRRAVQIDAKLIKRWVEQPDSNRGIALRLTGDSPPGELQFLAREAILDVDSTVANPQIEFLRGDEVIATSTPSADVYVYKDLRPFPGGAGGTMALAEWLPERPLLFFPIVDSLEAWFGGDAKRLTVNRAVLRLHLGGRSGPIADDWQLTLHRVRTAWSEESEAETDTLEAAESTASLPAALDTLRNELTLEIGPLVRAWVEGNENHGLAFRSTSEIVNTRRLLLYTREAADSLRPELEVVVTRPPDPRWGETAGGVR